MNVSKTRPSDGVIACLLFASSGKAVDWHAGDGGADGEATTQQRRPWGLGPGPCFCGVFGNAAAERCV